MGTIMLKLLLSFALIHTFEKTNFIFGSFIADKDVENCTSIIYEDHLPLKNMELVNYDFKLFINLHLFRGTCNILIHVFNKTKIIRLYAQKIEIKLEEIQLTTKEEATGNKKSKIQFPTGYRYSETTQVIYLLFENDIEPGYYYLYLDFSLSASKAFIEYESSSKYKRWFYTNVLEPIRVCSLSPCWNEPGMKATFNISVIHPRQYQALTNILEQDKFSMSDRWQWTYFMLTPSIAPSQLMIIVLDKDMTVNSDIMQDYVRYYSTSTMELMVARSTIMAARMSLSKYTALSTIPSTEHIIIPSPIKISGSTGFIIYRERDVVHFQDKDFIGVEVRIALIIGYQVGHEWIRRAVPQSSWPYEWISDSFATYYSYFFQIKFRQELEKLFVVQILQLALHYDIALKMKSLEHKICDANEIDMVLYSRFYHIKGAALLRMIKYILPKHDFDHRIGQFVTQSVLKPNFVNILWETLQGTDTLEKKPYPPLKDKMHGWSDPRTNPHIKDIMYGWLHQKHYPVLHVTSDDNNVIIKTICANGTDWLIPISIFIQSYINCNENITQFIWMRCNTTKIIPELKRNHFVILNMQQVGYYRVNYDSRNWRRIMSFLEHKDHTCISVQNRAHLIDDAYYFATVNKLDMAVFLNLIRYLKRETHYIAWYPMFNILYYMSAYWKLPESKFVKPIVLDILNGLLENIGYEEYPKDNGMTKTLRLLAAKWSCKLGDSGCRKAASAKLHAKYISPDTKILPWWNEWVYSMGMTQLNENTWHRIMNESLDAANMSTLRYIAFTDNNTRILYYIDFLKKIDYYEEIERKEFIRLYRFILKINMEKDVVREYVLKHFMEIRNRFYKRSRWLDLWGDIILNLHSKEQIDEILEFSKSHPYMLYSRMYELRKLIEARENELQKIRKKFSHF